MLNTAHTATDLLARFAAALVENAAHTATRTRLNREHNALLATAKTLGYSSLEAARNAGADRYTAPVQPTVAEAAAFAQAFGAECNSLGLEIA